MLAAAVHGDDDSGALTPVMRVLAVLAGLVLAASAAGQSVPWYFVATAMSCGSVESAYSNQASKNLAPGESVTLSFTAPTTNEDGSPACLSGYRFYAGTQPPQFPVMAIANNPGLTSFVWADVAGAAPPPSLGNPTQAPTFTYTVTLTAPVSVSVTISALDPASGEFDLAIAGSGPVTIDLSQDEFDWCKPNGELDPVATPTNPNLGVPNNDGVRARTVTFIAPIARTRCDVDPNRAFAGGSVTVQGVSKPLEQAGSAWSVRF